MKIIARFCWPAYIVPLKFLHLYLLCSWQVIVPLSEFLSFSCTFHLMKQPLLIIRRTVIIFIQHFLYARHCMKDFIVFNVIWQQHYEWQLLSGTSLHRLGNQDWDQEVKQLLPGSQPVRGRVGIWRQPDAGAQALKSPFSWTQPVGLVQFQKCFR